MTAALRTAHATARSLGRQLRMRGSGPGGRAKRKIWHGLDQTSLLLLGSTSNLASHREELCFILSGTPLSVFLQAASRKLCCIHICQSCGRSYWALWAQSSAALSRICFIRQALGRFHPGGLIVSILGAILVLFLWHKFHLHLPRG